MPELYKNQILFDWYAKFYSACGDSVDNVCRELFGIKNHVFRPHLFYPAHLESLCQLLPKSWSYDPDYLINNHSIFPFYQPFISIESAKRLLNGMIDKPCNNMKASIGIEAKEAYRTIHYSVCVFS